MTEQCLGNSNILGKCVNAFQYAIGYLVYEWNVRSYKAQKSRLDNIIEPEIGCDVEDQHSYKTKCDIIGMRIKKIESRIDEAVKQHGFRSLKDRGLNL